MQSKAASGIIKKEINTERRVDSMTPWDELRHLPVEILLVIGALAVMVLAVAVVFYVFQAIGLYKMAKRRGIYHAWLAWLPLGNQWVLGAISDQFQYLSKGKKKGKRHLLFWLQIASAVLTAGVSFQSMFYMQIPGLGMQWTSLYGVLIAVSILYTIFHGLACFDYFHSARPGSAVCFLIIGLLVPYCMPIFLFVDRKYDQSMPRVRTLQIPEE